MDLNRPDFDEYIHNLMLSPLDKVIDEVAGDADLRGYLATCAGNYRNNGRFDRNAVSMQKDGVDFAFFWENTQVFKDWTWKDCVAFYEENDRKSIAFWAPLILKALDQRMRSVHSQRIKEQLDKEASEQEARRKKAIAESFEKSIPSSYINASIDDFKGPWQTIIEGIDNGRSYLIFGGNGIGKTHFSYAIGRKLASNGKSCTRMRLSSILQKVSKEVTSSRLTAEEYIDIEFVHYCDFLIIDECDKVEQKDTAFRNFTYLIDRRCEELKQTLVLCNAVDEQELQSRIGPSVYDRFCSRKWKAEVVDFTEAKSKRAKEITA